MRRVPCSPRDSKTMSHMAERCRCRPSGPGGTFCVQAGFGCLGARVTRSRGELGVGGAQVLASRHGDDHLPQRMPRTGAGLVVAAERPVRRQPSLRPLPAALGVRPPPVPPGGSPCSSGNRGRGLKRRRAWCRMSGDHA